MAYCLIVDDSSVVRAVARRILEELKFDVDEAENGQIALDRCGADMPDLVLLDWKMPVLDGLGFLKELRGASTSCIHRHATTHLLFFTSLAASISM